MNSAVVAVGSNIDPFDNINKARVILEREHQLRGESRFVTTMPIGFAKQADFINGAFLILTRLDTCQFKSWLRDVESSLGRTHRGNRFGPRTIDLDLIVWNGEIVHKDFYERGFLKNAVLELLPDLGY